MTNVAILIPWCLICVTYFYFRSAVRGNANPVEEAGSPFQPVLAGYGAFATATIGNNTELDVLTNFVVILQGFQSWTRNPQYWSQAEGSWGFSLAPWAVIGLFLLLWLIISPRVTGVRREHPFQGTGLTLAQKLADAAPRLAPTQIDPNQSEWERSYERFLDSL